MPSITSGKNRSSILKRLSFRRPFARKARAASPVSVLDDEVFLLSPNDEKELDIAHTFSSSSSVEGGVSLMQDFGVSPASSESIDGMSESEKHDAMTTETPSPTKTSRQEEIINRVSISSMGNSDGAIFAWIRRT